MNKKSRTVQPLTTSVLPVSERSFRSSSSSNIVLDTDSFGNILTPSTTRTTSPALTERADNDTAESDAIKLPTIKYITIIETDNDNKAIFDLEFADVNQDKHKVLVIAKDMCTEMVSKGYESKVKLQDIMEMAVKMAKK